MSSCVDASSTGLIVITGPTAAGKSDVAFKLARELNGEIISADSTLVYRGLDIGTAKPSAEEMREITHHCVDIRDPVQPYSAADFCADANAAVTDILSRGRQPVIVGGTMLYLKALLQGMSSMPESDPKIRQEIEETGTAKGWAAVHAMLERVDPVSAKRIHPNHSQRLSRALEVWRISGKPMSEWQTGFSGGLLDKHFSVTQFVLAPRDRRYLHEKIARRFDRMLAQGFIDEVDRLRQIEGVHVNLPCVRAVGYRQVWAYLDGDLNYREMCDKAIAATRQLAKRQLTWLRSWQELRWIDTQSASIPNDSVTKTGRNRECDEIVTECLRILYESTI